MNGENDILTALRALREADRGLEASPEVEQRVRFAFRRRKRQRIWKRAAVLGAAAAAVVIAIVATREDHPRTVAHEPVRQNIEIARPVFAAPVAPAAKIARLRPIRRQREMVTEFFPLLDAAPPVDRGELVRVSLPAAAMREVGLPVREDRLSDRVQADVLVSEEGLATAIRFVKSSQ